MSGPSRLKRPCQDDKCSTDNKAQIHGCSIIIQGAAGRGDDRRHLERRDEMECRDWLKAC